MLDIDVTGLNQLGMGMAGLCLELVNMCGTHGHELKCLFIRVKPAPFFEAVLVNEAKTETFPAVAIHKSLRGNVDRL